MIETPLTHIDPQRATAMWGAGPWWVAHDHPERPPDDWTLWSWRCDACVMHLIAASSTPRLLFSNDVADDGDALGPFEGTIADTLVEVRAWREANGLRRI